MPDDRPRPRAAAKDLALLAAISLLLYGLGLGARDLWNPNEPLYGRAVVEMAEHGAWLVPTVNDVPFAEKPPLWFWAARATSLLAGRIDEATLRLPNALAGLLAVLLVYLLVVPYAGRAAARWAGVLLATQYLVWWTAREAQMDNLVMASTLGTLLPLTRVLDAGLPPRRGWALAGLSAGLGVLAKGPVAVILPGLAFLAWVLLRRLPARASLRGAWAGLPPLLLVGGSGYALLLIAGETAALHEVLVRQNLTRFTDAWDHVKPWPYYAQYAWHYVPAVALVPLAVGLPGRSEGERALHRLAGAWIATTVLFFTLSTSKRAPYVLPIAPAVAILAAAPLARFAAGTLEGWRRRAVHAALALLGVLGIGLAAALLVAAGRHPDLAAPLREAAVVAGLLGALGVLAAWALRARPALLAMASLAGLVALYLYAGVRAVPALDVRKSARGFADEVRRRAAPADPVASYRVSAWQGGYPYYAGRSIPALGDPDALRDFWSGPAPRFVIVEGPHGEEARALLAAEPVVERRIGDRTALLFGR